jgi:thiol-disulfide isomerase/thioredoxin
MRQRAGLRAENQARFAVCFATLAAGFIWAKGMVVGALVVSLAACTMASLGPGAGGSDHPPRLVGYSRQYTLLTPVRTARLTPFRTADGEAIDLSHFRGKVVLLNFWATWCAPCVREMPSLNRLAAEMDSDGLAVVPVAIDRAGLSAVIPFYRDHGLDHLAMYLDPDRRTAYTHTNDPNNAEFALYGLPISYLVDRQGRVRGYIAGAVNWDSEAAKDLIRYYTRQIES